MSDPITCQCAKTQAACLLIRLWAKRLRSRRWLPWVGRSQRAADALTTHTWVPWRVYGCTAARGTRSRLHALGDLGAGADCASSKTENSTIEMYRRMH